MSRDPKWDEILTPIMNSPEITSLKKKIKEQRAVTTVYPKAPDTFEAFNYFAWDKLKIVIVGAEPYNNESAHGLAFSSNNKLLTTELAIIFEEIHRDIFAAYPYADCFKDCNLYSWASQGILLLNATLSVEAGKPGSHKEIGWDYFTTEILKSLNDYPAPIVFIFMGKHAEQFAPLITNGTTNFTTLPSSQIGTYKHLILTSVYPNKKNKEAFIGSGIFGKALQFLTEYRTETQEGFEVTNPETFDIMLTKIQSEYAKHKYPLIKGALPNKIDIFDRQLMFKYLKNYFPYYSFLNLTT